MQADLSITFCSLGQYWLKRHNVKRPWTDWGAHSISAGILTDDAAWATEEEGTRGVGCRVSAYSEALDGATSLLRS